MSTKNKKGKNVRKLASTELDDCYGESGAGQAVKTIQGKASAINQFNRMLQFISNSVEGSEKIAVVSFDKLPEEILCDIKLFGKFADYLVNHAVSQISDKEFARDTALQYFSGGKEAAKEKFPNNDIWKGHDDTKTGWYIKKRKTMMEEITRRCIEKGVPLKGEPVEIGEKMLLLICISLLGCNLRDSAEAVFIRVMFLIVYHSAGRVAEPADASWNLSRWDSERCCFEMFWQNRKTLIQQPLNYFPHYSDYKLCIYNALAHYFIMCSPSMVTEQFTNGFEWLFPELAKLSPLSVSSKLNGYLEEFMGGDDSSNRYKNCTIIFLINKIFIINCAKKMF